MHRPLFGMATAALLALAPNAVAQTYPVRPVRLVVFSAIPVRLTVNLTVIFCPVARDIFLPSSSFRR
jgi:hypothetical protein